MVISVEKVNLKNNRFVIYRARVGSPPIIDGVDE